MVGFLACEKEEVKKSLSIVPEALYPLEEIKGINKKKKKEREKEDAR